MKIILKQNRDFSSKRGGVGICINFQADEILLYFSFIDKPILTSLKRHILLKPSTLQIITLIINKYLKMFLKIT